LLQLLQRIASDKLFGFRGSLDEEVKPGGLHNWRFDVIWMEFIENIAGELWLGIVHEIFE